VSRARRGARGCDGRRATSCELVRPFRRRVSFDRSIDRVDRPLRFVCFDRIDRSTLSVSIDSIDRRNRSTQSIDSNDSIATPRGRRPTVARASVSSVVSRASRVAGAPSTSIFVVRIARRGVRRTLNSCAENKREPLVVRRGATRRDVLRPRARAETVRAKFVRRVDRARGRPRVAAAAKPPIRSSGAARHRARHRARLRTSRHAPATRA